MGARLRSAWLPCLMSITLVVGVYGAGPYTGQEIRHEYQMRGTGIHLGNAVEMLVYSDGRFCDWMIPGRAHCGVYPAGSGRSYVAEMSLVFGAMVIDSSGLQVPLIDHCFMNGIGFDPETGIPFCLNPIPGFTAPDSASIAMSDDPSSWPESWPGFPEDWEGMWAGEAGPWPLAGQESFYRIHDEFNAAVVFNPDPSEPEHFGLGLELDSRNYQEMHPLINDVFFHKTVFSNTGATDYSQFTAGLYVDFDIGDDGDQRDDDISIDLVNDIVIFWDHDGWSMVKGGFNPHRVALQILETPGNSEDGFDNDEDGLVDESPSDGIDNDGDWMMLYDDVGSDGIGPDDAGYLGPDPDGTEGNGSPDIGEPNFEITDFDEVDHLGIQAWLNGPWPTVNLLNHLETWDGLNPANSSEELPQIVDQTCLLGTGYFPMAIDGTEVLAFAIIFGENDDQLIERSIYAKHFYRTQFTDGTENFLVSLEGEDLVYEENLDISWDHDLADRIFDFDVLIRNQPDGDWRPLAKVGNADNMASLPVASLPDGVFYQLRMIGHYDQQVLLGETDEMFTINGPAESPPQAFIRIDSDETILADTVAIEWWCGDPENDPTQFTLEYSFDGGNSFVLMMSSDESSGIHSWNSESCPNTSQLLFKATADNQSGSSEYVIGPFSLHNGSMVAEDIVEHPEGNGFAEIAVHVVDPDDLVAASYELSFSEIDSSMRYYLVNSTNSDSLIEGLPLLPSVWTPPVEGISLEILTPSAPEADLENSGFSVLPYPDVGWEIMGEPFSAFEFLPYEHDYRLSVYDEIVDTTVNNKEVNFTVTNLEDGSQMHIAFIGEDDGQLGSPHDRVMPVVMEAGETIISWTMHFYSPFDDPDSSAFPAGTEFFLRTQKPLDDEDRFTFTIDPEIHPVDPLDGLPVSMSLQQNFPNPFNDHTRFVVSLEDTENIRLRIHDIRGRAIRSYDVSTLKPGQNELFWNALDDEGRPAGAGIYFTRLEIGNQVQMIKMVLLK